MRHDSSSIAGRHGKVLHEPLLMRSVGQPPLQPASTERSSNGFLRSGGCFVVTNGRIAKARATKTAEMQRDRARWEEASPMHQAGRNPGARLVGHVRQCHCRDLPSCRHHKASADLRSGQDERVNAHEIGAPEVRHPARGQHCATGPDSHRGIGASGGRVVKATPRRLNRCLLVRWEGT